MPAKSRNQKIKSAPLATRAALRALYPNSVPVSISQLTRGDMLKVTEVLCHIMNPVSNPSLIPSLRSRTLSLIEHLPPHLQTVADLPGISETSVVRAIRNLTFGSDQDIPQPSEMCRMHMRLSGQLIASARCHLERAVRKHLQYFTSRPGVHSPVRSTFLSDNASSAIKETEGIMGMLLTADEFLADYRRPPPEFCTNGCVNVSCDACILTKVGSSTTIVTTLGAIALLRIGSGHSKSLYWLDWLDGWILNLEESPGKIWSNSKKLAEELIQYQGSHDKDRSASRGKSEEVPLFLSPQLPNGEVDYARQRQIIGKPDGHKVHQSARNVPDGASRSTTDLPAPGYSRVISILDCYKDQGAGSHSASMRPQALDALTAGIKAAQSPSANSQSENVPPVTSSKYSTTTSTEDQPSLRFSWSTELGSTQTGISTLPTSHTGSATPIASSVCLPDFQPTMSTDKRMLRSDAAKDDRRIRQQRHNSHISLHLTPPTPLVVEQLFPPPSPPPRAPTVPAKSLARTGIASANLCTR